MDQAQPRVIVVGGGVMGLAAGCALAARGARVQVLERFTIGHERASSHGLSRALRYEYGPKEYYAQMVARSLDLWRRLEDETGRLLYTETGVLTLGRDDDGETLEGYAVLRAMGLPITRLSAGECAERFPQFRVDRFSAITYDTRGGMLYAGECLLALADVLRARGGDLREGVRVARVEPEGRGAKVTCEDGTALRADCVVVTAGPWSRDVLPDVSLPLTVTHQQVCYFGGLSPALFGVGAFPVFLAGMEYYGFPLHRSGWFKAASHIFGAEQDPNAALLEDAQETANVREFLTEVIPAATEGDLAHVDRCMYDVTPDEDFILDYHPGGSGVVIGCGFSGHGFKFGPLIGEVLAALALEEEPMCSCAPFRLSRFAA